MVSLSRSRGKCSNCHCSFLCLLMRRLRAAWALFIPVNSANRITWRPHPPGLVGEKCDDAAEWNYLANLGHKVAGSIGEQSNFRSISNAAKAAEMAEVITSVALEASNCSCKFNCVWWESWGLNPSNRWCRDVTCNQIRYSVSYYSWLNVCASSLSEEDVLYFLKFSKKCNENTGASGGYFLI